MIKVIKTDNIDATSDIAIIATKKSVIEVSFFTDAEYAYVKQKIEKGDSFITINQYTRQVYISIIDNEKNAIQVAEDCRKAGNKVQSYSSESTSTSMCVFHAENEIEYLLAFTEGFLLGAYKFVKYFKNNEEKKHKIAELRLICSPLEQKRIEHLVNIAEALYIVRDMVNEPVSFLNASQLASEIQKMGADAGFTVDVFNKSKIEALKMGGLLAVNQGSIDPPTFTVMEWKPANAINSKPYVLVGKGVVYDTGGLSLKPTGDSMDYMKCDMSGAAIVAGVMYSVAKNNLPIHVVALAPATDNRPSGNAYAPGDVVTIMNGTNVEVLNSDAEGRMILADALCYAKQYDPELVIDVATLTGSASMAIGPYALVAMGTASDEIKDKLKASGNNTYERIVEFPLWDEYSELIKSDIADLKNVGGKNAGAITAGKFLESFTSYPWMHFDIAGAAFSKKNDNYRGKGGTGFSMRLLVDFLYNRTVNK
jgi:leucyl aminopeptidase